MGTRLYKEAILYLHVTVAEILQKNPVEEDRVSFQLLLNNIQRFVNLNTGE